MGNTLRNIAKDDSGKPIITTYKGRTVWVSFETHRGKTKYRLADPAKKPKPFRGSLRADKNFAIKEFYEYIQDMKNIDIVIYEPVYQHNPHFILPEFTKEQIKERDKYEKEEADNRFKIWSNYRNQLKAEIEEIKDEDDKKYELEKWENTNHYLRPPKFTAKQIEELKKGKSKEDLEFIDKYLIVLENEALLHYRVKEFDKNKMAGIAKETGKKVLTIPNVKIKPVREIEYYGVDEEDSNYSEKIKEKYQIHSIDKNYIIEEFMKMLADNPAEIAALTEIPQFVDLPVPKK